MCVYIIMSPLLQTVVVCVAVFVIERVQSLPSSLITS